MLTCTQLQTQGVVAIIGAGPAGLTLARLLQMHGFKVRVFERDASPSARKQGGSLDLHTDSGQLALDKAGLTTAFQHASRVAGQAFKVMSHLGQIRVAMTADEQGTSKPEIDRGDLRQLLLTALADDAVAWDHTALRVAPTRDGRQQLEFVNQAPFTADLVIGADGVRSKVRAQLSSVPPRYVGLTMFETLIRPELWRNSAIATLVGEGAVLITGTGKGVWIQRNSDEAIRLYFSLPVTEDWPRALGFELSDTEAVLATLRHLYQDWSPEILAMLLQVTGDFSRWPLYALPPGHAWRTQPGLTILGDAAHVMPPFTGKGANMALLDALDLASSLSVGATAPVSSIVAAFEQRMQARMHGVVSECLERMGHIYGITVDFAHPPMATPPERRAPPNADLIH